MKNKEFFKEKIFEIACNFKRVGVRNGEPIECRIGTGCYISDCDFRDKYEDCEKLLKEWLGKEHEEQKIQPEVKSLKKDDRVLVSNDGKIWRRRYFEKYDSNQELVYTYNDGTTSWTSNYDGSWTYAKLPKPEEEPKEEPETDWSKVPVDAKIFVKQCECEEWVPRHFAKFENRAVYAWVDGKTSHTTKETIKWTSAKLAEGEE